MKMLLSHLENVHLQFDGLQNIGKITPSEDSDYPVKRFPAMNFSLEKNHQAKKYWRGKNIGEELSETLK
jgi:hypothetical protein